MQVLDLAIICKFILELFLGRFFVDVCDEHDPAFDGCCSFVSGVVGGVGGVGEDVMKRVSSADDDEWEWEWSVCMRMCVWDAKKTYNGRRVVTRCCPCPRGARTWPRLPSNPFGLYAIRNSVSLRSLARPAVRPRVVTYGRL